MHKTTHNKHLEMKAFTEVSLLYTNLRSHSHFSFQTNIIIVSYMMLTLITRAFYSSVCKMNVCVARRGLGYSTAHSHNIQTVDKECFTTHYEFFYKDSRSVQGLPTGTCVVTTSMVPHWRLDSEAQQEQSPHSGLRWWHLSAGNRKITTVSGLMQWALHTIETWRNKSTCWLMLIILASI